jgi:hypothetical protein
MIEWIFAKIYWWRCKDIRIVKVKGWRTARMVTKGGTVQTGTFLFKIGKWHV